MQSLCVADKYKTQI